MLTRSGTLFNASPAGGAVEGASLVNRAGPQLQSYGMAAGPPPPAPPVLPRLPPVAPPVARLPPVASPPLPPVSSVEPGPCFGAAPQPPSARASASQK